jgi:hypothetical protein
MVGNSVGVLVFISRDQKLDTARLVQRTASGNATVNSCWSFLTRIQHLGQDRSLFWTSIRACPSVFLDVSHVWYVRKRWRDRDVSAGSVTLWCTRNFGSIACDASKNKVTTAVNSVWSGRERRYEDWPVQFSSSPFEIFDHHIDRGYVSEILPLVQKRNKFGTSMLVLLQVPFHLPSPVTE